MRDRALAERTIKRHRDRYSLPLVLSNEDGYIGKFDRQAKDVAYLVRHLHEATGLHLVCSSGLFGFWTEGEGGRRLAAERDLGPNLAESSRGEDYAGLFALEWDRRWLSNKGWRSRRHRSVPTIFSEDIIAPDGVLHVVGYHVGGERDGLPDTIPLLTDDGWEPAGEPLFCSAWDFEAIHASLVTPNEPFRVEERYPLVEAAKRHYDLPGAHSVPANGKTLTDPTFRGFLCKWNTDDRDELKEERIARFMDPDANTALIHDAGGYVLCVESDTPEARGRAEQLGWTDDNAWSFSPNGPRHVITFREGGEWVPHGIVPGQRLGTANAHDPHYPEMKVGDTLCGTDGPRYTPGTLRAITYGRGG